MNIYLLNFKTPDQMDWPLECGISTSDMHAQFTHHLKQSIAKHCPHAGVIHNELEFTESEVASVFKRVNKLRDDMQLSQGYVHKIGTNFLKLTKQAEIAKQETENFIFMDTDMLLTGDISEAFKENFDIAFTNRNYKNPINGGMVFCRPGAGGEIYQYWMDVADMFLGDAKKLNKYFPQRMGICQSSLAYMLDDGLEVMYEVKYFPCKIYNNTRTDGWKNKIPDGVKCLHWNHKGTREYLVSGKGNLSNIAPENIKKISSEYDQYKTIPNGKELAVFEKKLGYKCNLENPKTFNEKIMWKKYNDRDPLITLTCDKLKAREYVANRGYSNLLTNLVWYGKNIKSKHITRGIIKANQSSGRLFVVKKGMKIDNILNTVNKWPDEKYGVSKGEWGYYGVDPMLMMEKMPNDKPMKTNIKGLCFHGDVKYFLYTEYSFEKAGGKSVITGQMYDTKWNLCEVKLSWQDGVKQVKKPENLDEIIQVCNDLSKPFQFVRVDLMLDDTGRLYFSELTHYPTSGHIKFNPDKWDRKLGDLWKNI